MDFIKTWKTVPFDLELIVDVDYRTINDENIRVIDGAAEKTKKIISNSYPQIKLLQSITISGKYRGNKGVLLFMA